MQIGGGSGQCRLKREEKEAWKESASRWRTDGNMGKEDKYVWESHGEQVVQQIFSRESHHGTLY